MVVRSEISTPEAEALEASVEALEAEAVLAEAGKGTEINLLV